MARTDSVIFLLYVGLPALTVVISAGLSYWVYATRRETDGAKPFVVTLAFMQVWMLLLIAHLLASGVTIQRWLVIVESLAAHLTIAVFLLAVSVYTGAGYHRNWAFRAGIGVYVGAFAVLAATNARHEWLYQNLYVMREPFSYVAPVPGLGYVAIIAFAMVLVGYSLYVLVRFMLFTGRHAQPQLLLIVAAGLSIAIAEVGGSLGLLPADGLHHAAYGTLPAVVFSTLALFRLRLLDVQPVARNTIVEHLEDPILITDPDGRVVDVNERSVELWPGLDGRVGEPLERFAPDLDSLTLDTGDGDRIVLTVDGQPRYFSATVTPVRRQRTDAVGWYAIVLRDITDIERSRRQLELQNERLDHLSSTVAHDLRNPIQVAEGYTDLVADSLAARATDDDDFETELSQLESTSSSLQRMDQIIDDVLQMAREGQLVEETETVHLERLAREAWTTVDTGDADLVLDADCTVEADRGRLRSILENLFRNSVEHAGPDVTVTVEATADGFAVADDGPGIPPDYRETVFEYGYSGDPEGTGFGLAIVRTMAESHGWTVAVDDGFDGGARFVFDLRGGPAVDGRPADRAHDAPETDEIVTGP